MTFHQIFQFQLLTILTDHQIMAHMIAILLNISNLHQAQIKAFKKLITFQIFVKNYKVGL